MANNGTFHTSSYNNIYLVFNWEIQSQSIEDNTTTISWSLTSNKTNYSYSVVCSDIHVVIDNDVVYDKPYTYHIDATPGMEIASGIKVISHNDDGSKSFVASADAGIYVWHSNCSGTDSWDLPTIPRASTLSLSKNSFNVGDTVTATITRASSAFTHTIEFYINNTYYKKYTNVDVSKSFKIPKSWYDAMPSTTSCTAYCRLTTYKESDQIGEQIRQAFIVNVPNDVVPNIGTITLTPDKINGNDILVKGKNKLTIKVSDCIPGDGTNIVSYVFSGPSIDKTLSSSLTNAEVSISSVTNITAFENEQATLTYTVTVIDGRGRMASKTETVICYDYYTPYLTSIDVYRADDDGIMNINGTYLKCIYEVHYASVNSTNDATIMTYYNNQAIASQLINLNGDTDTTYNVYFIITDQYGGYSKSETLTVFGQARIFNATLDGTGFAIGKMAESGNLFECRWDAKFNGAVSGPSGFSTSSDARAKKNIQDINVDIVDKLRPVQYELAKVTDGKVHYGFIAQEVDELLSDAGLNSDAIGLIGQIINNGRQEYVLTYTEFIPLLTKKCQLLQEETDMLKQEITELKNIVRLMSC